MTEAQLIAAANAKNPSNEVKAVIALVEVSRDDLIAALKSASNERAKVLLAGAENSGKNSTLYVQREHILEALADEPAEI